MHLQTLSSVLAEGDGGWAFLLTLAVLEVANTQVPLMLYLLVFSREWRGMGSTAPKPWICPTIQTGVIVAVLTPASSSSPFHPGFVPLFG